MTRSCYGLQENRKLGKIGLTPTQLKCEDAIGRRKMMTKNFGLTPTQLKCEDAIGRRKMMMNQQWRLIASEGLK